MAVIVENRSIEKIMIVDDVSENIQTLQRHLQKAGYSEIVSTTDSTEAVSMVGSESPALRAGVGCSASLRTARQSPDRCKLGQNDGTPFRGLRRRTALAATKRFIQLRKHKTRKS